MAAHAGVTFLEDPAGSLDVQIDEFLTFFEIKVLVEELNAKGVGEVVFDEDKSDGAQDEFFTSDSDELLVGFMERVGFVELLDGV